MPQIGGEYPWVTERWSVPWTVFYETDQEECSWNGGRGSRRLLGVGFLVLAVLAPEWGWRDGSFERALGPDGLRIAVAVFIAVSPGAIGFGARLLAFLRARCGWFAVRSQSRTGVVAAGELRVVADDERP